MNGPEVYESPSDTYEGAALANDGAAASAISAAVSAAMHSALRAMVGEILWRAVPRA